MSLGSDSGARKSGAPKPVGRLRWIHRSSTLRLTVLLSAIFTAGMAVAIFIALSFGEDALIRRVDSTLDALAVAAAADDVEFDSAGAVVRPVDELGRLPAPFARAARRGGGTIELDDDYRGVETWRSIVAQNEDGDRILIALPLDDTEEALDVLGGALWTTAGFVLAFVLLIGLVAGLLAQRRLGRIGGALGRLAEGDLTARTGIKRSSDDLDDLARQLDRTAGELERLVAQTRHLSATIAHDLRTPLARLRARLETLPDGDARGAALEEAERLAGIFDTIMRVARIEAAHGTDGFDRVDLGALATELSEIFGAVVEDAGKQLHLTVTAPATVQADRKMLVQALGNLIQNALVHGGPDVTLFVDGGGIGVADNGLGVDPAQFEEITKPMVRLDSARTTEGTGLGLALVRAVATRHGAKLALSANAPSGLRVALNFTDM
ncbi:MAG: HAMP domain-containing histidine kinase [Devosiaceae bacterium]|nr:HAMP domain-containing histidine kinase [Devosiaceae bacterium MH13]